MNYANAAQGRQEEVQQLTFAQVKKIVDEEGFVKRPPCPDAVCNEILKSKMPIQQIQNVRKALDLIANAAEKWSGSAFDALGNEEIAKLFVSNPEKVADAFAQIAKSAGKSAGRAFDILANDEVAAIFANYANGKTLFGTLMLAIRVHGTYAIETGRRLDDLHDNEKERMDCLATLSKTDVLALLMSNPEYFFTSTNHLLFDRLHKDFKPGELSTFVKKNGLEGTELFRNLIFRAANYDRLYGKEKSVFKKEEMPSVLASLLQPLSDQRFDSRYFYLLANSVDNIGKDLQAFVGKKLADTRPAALTVGIGSEGAEKKSKAIDFLLGQMQNPERKEIVFSTEKYRSNDGKLGIVQIFDKEDTEKDHWVLSQQWFAKYGKPRTGENGEMIYDTKGARIVLFMGEHAQENQEFLKKKLDEDQNLILTFRGHSYSLEENIPHDIFGNRKANILFIPGSCGSAGSVPDYMTSNPNTKFEFVSNTSTGRGQVTNALVDIFINEAVGGNARTYNEIIKKDQNNCSLIEKNGADCRTLQVATLGEQLIAYVQSGAAGYRK